MSIEVLGFVDQQTARPERWCVFGRRFGLEDPKQRMEEISEPLAVRGST